MAVVAAAVSFTLLRCTSFADSSAVIADGGADGGAAEATVADAHGAADAADATDAGQPGDAAFDSSTHCGDMTCPGRAGPCSVRIGSLCIDATEVTVADYTAFVAEKHGTFIDAGAPCNSVEVKVVGSRPDPALPVTAVTFCEARAYCIHAGKHLCGHIAGGTIAPTRSTTLDSAWFYACTGGTGVVTTNLGGKCQLGAAGPVSSGTSCQGGVPGLFDMVGNVFEWTDALDVAQTGAQFVGGGFVQPVGSDCAYVSGESIDYTAADVGFRCCSP
jgi:sulfatase modifying factor 1